jgi:hypothetical protein
MSGQLEGMVTVYGYRRWDETLGRHLSTETKATIDALVRMHQCTPIEGTAEEVPASWVTTDGLYHPPTSIRQGARAARRVSGGRE